MSEIGALLGDSPASCCVSVLDQVDQDTADMSQDMVLQLAQVFALLSIADGIHRTADALDRIKRGQNLDLDW